MEYSCEKNKGGRQLETRQWLAGETFVVSRPLSKRNIVIASLLSIFLVAILLLIILCARFVGSIEIQLSERDNPIKTKPFIDSQVAQLKSQLIALISGSINNKLQILEAGIQDGNAGRGELLVIQALRNDFDLLQSYAPEASSVHDARGDRKSQQYLDSLILREISYLKSVFFFGIAFCGITVFFTGALWLRAMYRFRKIEAQFAIASALLDKPRHCE